MTVTARTLDWLNWFQTNLPEQSIDVGFDAWCDVCMLLSARFEQPQHCVAALTECPDIMLR